VQWTNGNAGPYGEDPYGGAGYTYACGHDGYGGEGYGHEGYGGDTATLTWDAVQLAQWTQPQPAAWDTAHGDVLTVPVQDGPESEPARPVFVDSSGRRQRLVRRAARLLVIPAGGYVALLISTVLGGPGVSAPFVPQPDATHRAAPRVSAPASPSGTGHPAGATGSAAAHDPSRPPVRQTSSPPLRPAATTASAPAAAPTRTASPTATAGPAPAPSPRGRALGTSHKPVK
jgi:hypothetical protein